MDYSEQKFSFATEKIYRFFNKSWEAFTCYVLQMAIDKNQLVEGNYKFQVKKNDRMILEVPLYFNPIEKKVIDRGSHEDPLIETEQHYLVCLQLSAQVLKELIGEISIDFIDDKNYLVESGTFYNLLDKFSLLPEQNSKIYPDYKLYTDKRCVLRIHVGTPTGAYHEEQYLLNAGDIFPFKDYLTNNAYIGLQCSYEIVNKEENKYIVQELEEKHIMIGQKGMINSHMFFDGINYHHALLPFNKSYQRIMYQNNLPIDDQEYVNYVVGSGIEVNKIEDLLLYLSDKSIIFFETTLEFVVEQYRNHSTYGIDNTYSNLPRSNRYHIDLEVCQSCCHNSKCVQIVPSGLSWQLFKKNLGLENQKQCKVFQLIEKAV